MTHVPASQFTPSASGSASMYKRRFPLWVTLIGVMIVALFAIFALEAIDNVTENNGQSTIAVARIKEQSYRVIALEKEAEEEKTLTPEHAREAQDARDQMRASLKQLTQLDSGGPTSRSVRIAYDKYEADLNEMFRLFAAGELEEVEEWDEEHVDPAYERLLAELGKASDFYEQSAVRADDIADMGTAAVIALAALLIAGLFWGAEQSRRDRQVAEATALRKSEERFRLLVQNSSDLIIILGADGALLYLSESLDRLLGRKAEDGIGESIFKSPLTHPDDLDSLRTFFIRILDNPNVDIAGEFRLQHADGSWRYMEAVAKNLLDDPRVGGIVANYRDISGRKQAEEALRRGEQQLRTIVTNVPIVLFALDHDGVFTLSEGRGLEALGLNPGQVVGLSAFDVYKDAPQVIDQVRRALSGEEINGTTAVGELIFESSYSPVRTVNGEVAGVIGVSTDITERKKAEDALRESEARLGDAQRIARLGNWGRDFRTGTVLWSEEVYRIFGFDRETFVPTQDAYENCIHPEDSKRVSDGVSDTLQNGALLDHDYRIVRPDGEVRFIHELAEVIYDEAGRPARMIGTVHDISERKALENALAHQAFHDPLTNLPNRALFMNRLEHALAHAGRRHQTVAVLFLDLDGFKFINDSLGHEAGDALLVAAGERLQLCLRPEDTVARLGGDEFTILLDNIGDGIRSVHVADRIIQALQAPFMISGREVFVTVSIGIAHTAAGLSRVDDLMRGADIAMYRAKQTGKGRYEIFNTTMGSHAVERLDNESDLRRAIEREEFEVYYQPKLELATGRIEEVEALVRWQHPQRGLISPADFIPLAEETGLIIPIGRWVLEESCRQARQWQQAYPSTPPLVVSVNLSARQFVHPELVEEVAQSLRETGLDPHTLQIEITENVVMQDAELAMFTLRKLKAMGIRLALDDFGTGYSSLSYLKRFPVDTLKIDKSFVDGLGQESEDTAIVQAVITLAHTLGMQVTAEGVETNEQRQQLQLLGCELGQGYLFARPLPANALEALLVRGQHVYSLRVVTHA